MKQCCCWTQHWLAAVSTRSCPMSRQSSNGCNHGKPTCSCLGTAPVLRYGTSDTRLDGYSAMLGKVHIHTHDTHIVLRAQDETAVAGMNRHPPAAFGVRPMFPAAEESDAVSRAAQSHHVSSGCQPEGGLAQDEAKKGASKKMKKAACVVFACIPDTRQVMLTDCHADGLNCALPTEVQSQ